MGYCINLEESTMKFTLDNARKIIIALKNNLDKKMKEDDFFCYDWCNLLTLENIDIENLTDRDIIAVWRSLRYDVFYIVDNGTFYVNDFLGEKLGSDFEIFSVAAPFIEDGQYLEFLGEDGKRFRYVVKDKKLHECIGKIIWEY